MGPAGAGKTTLAQSIQRADATVHVGLSLWGLPRSRLVRGAIALVPTIVLSAVRKRRLRWPEIRQMIRVDALRWMLRRMKSRHPMILLDEGPVYGISWLDLTFAERGAKAPARWRRRAVKRWSRLIDSVVFLDATDEELAHRIRRRGKEHRMQHASNATIRRFANGYRKALADVVAELNNAGGRLQFDRIRTTDSIDTASDRLQATIARHKHGD